MISLQAQCYKTFTFLISFSHVKGQANQIFANVKLFVTLCRVKDTLCAVCSAQKNCSVAKGEEQGMGNLFQGEREVTAKPQYISIILYEFSIFLLCTTSQWFFRIFHFFLLSTSSAYFFSKSAEGQYLASRQGLQNIQSCKDFKLGIWHKTDIVCMQLMSYISCIS